MHAQAETAAAEPQLDVRAVHLWRGERHLLRGTSFVLKRGELLQVVGPNGVGKTSLLRCVAGLLPTESGEIVWRGRQLHDCRDDYPPAARVPRSYQCAQAGSHGAREPSLQRRVCAVLSAAGTARHVHSDCVSSMRRPAGARVVGGTEAARRASARILLTRAALWILDEPITNLDSAGIALFEECMAEHLRTRRHDPDRGAPAAAAGTAGRANAGAALMQS